MRHYIEVILGVFLNGAGLADLWPPALVLLAIGVVLFTSALIAFQAIAIENTDTQDTFAILPRMDCDD